MISTKSSRWNLAVSHEVCLEYAGRAIWPQPLLHRAMTAALCAQGVMAVTAIFGVAVQRYTNAVWPLMVLALVAAACSLAGRPQRLP